MFRMAFNRGGPLAPKKNAQLSSGEELSLSRNTSAEYYNGKLRSRTRKRILLSVLAAIVVVLVGASVAIASYINEINQKIVEMLRPADMKAPIELVFQSIEGLHEACPNHPGDWYFTGHYPTPGGVKLVNQAFVNYINKTYTLKENDGGLLSNCKK